MSDITKKLETLTTIAREFNSRVIPWAVGASLMLYFRGLTQGFNDIDLMVSEDRALDAKAELMSLGSLKPKKPEGSYRTSHFYEFDIDGVDVDMMAGLVIVKDGVAYPCPFDEKTIDTHITVGGQTVPLQSLELWREYYGLMGRAQRVSLIDAALCKKGGA